MEEEERVNKMKEKGGVEWLLACLYCFAGNVLCLFVVVLCVPCIHLLALLFFFALLYYYSVK